jgi:hypothetical protein
MKKLLIKFLYLLILKFYSIVMNEIVIFEQHGLLEYHIQYHVCIVRYWYF